MQTKLGPTRSWLASPMLQFFAAGAVIFMIAALAEPDDSDPSPETVTVTSAEQENLAALFEKTWKRPPTPDELDGLIEARLREELFYREALALGLDEGDAVVRRRLAQKIDFIVDDMAARRDPTEAELARFLDENAERYQREPVLTFRQVYLSPKRRGRDIKTDSGVILARLRKGADPGAMGDAIGLPAAMQAAAASEVSRVFGGAFTEAVAKADPGHWSGPVRSAYGAHLIKLVSREDQGAAALDDVRARVERDWRAAQREEALKAYTEALKDKYSARVERQPGETSQ